MLDVGGMQEDIRDLLAPDLAASPGVHIREVGGSICLAGAHETEVGSRDEMATLLDQVQHPAKPASILSEHDLMCIGSQTTRLRARAHVPGRVVTSRCTGDASDGMQKVADNLQTGRHAGCRSEALLEA